MKKINAPDIGGLEKRLKLLREENSLLNNKINLKNTQITNSLTSLTQGITQGSQSNLNSFSNLSYFMNAAPLTINYSLLTYLYKTHGLLQRIIGIPVKDAFRGGIEITSDKLNPDDIKKINDYIEENDVLKVLIDVGIWARLYGGAALLINTDQNPSTPLDERRIRKLGFYAANRWEIVSPKRYSEYYDFYGIRFHKSRVITVAGNEAPYIVRWTLQNWGMSELEGLLEDYNIYLRTKDVIYELLREAKIDVYKFNQYAQQLASDSATQKTQARIESINALKNYRNAIILDKEDDYEQKQLTFTGLAEVHNQNQIFLASASGIPLTKLFGLNASSYNSGETDLENYNCKVESEVRDPMRMATRTVISLINCLLFKRNQYDFSFSYKPLRVLSSVEEEEIRTSENNRYLSLYDRGLLGKQEIMQIQQMKKMIPIETKVAAGGPLEIPISSEKQGESDNNGKE